MLGDGAPQTPHLAAGSSGSRAATAGAAPRPPPGGPRPPGPPGSSSKGLATLSRILIKRPDCSLTKIPNL